MKTRILAVLIGAAVLAVPATSVAKPGKGHDKAAAKHVTKKSKKPKRVMFVFKGTFTAPGTVEVVSGNAHVRKGGFVGNAVTFDLEGAKVVVADTNGDGARDLADVKDGDRVLVQARLPRRTEFVAPVESEPTEAVEGDTPEAGEDETTDAIVARKLIDRTNRPVADETEDEGEVQPTP